MYCVFVGPNFVAVEEWTLLCLFLSRALSLSPPLCNIGLIFSLHLVIMMFCFLYEHSKCNKRFENLISIGKVEKCANTRPCWYTYRLRVSIRFTNNKTENKCGSLRAIKVTHFLCASLFNDPFKMLSSTGILLFFAMSVCACCFFSLLFTDSPTTSILGCGCDDPRIFLLLGFCFMFFYLDTHLLVIPWDRLIFVWEWNKSNRYYFQHGKICNNHTSNVK